MFYYKKSILNVFNIMNLNVVLKLKNINKKTLILAGEIRC